MPTKVGDFWSQTLNCRLFAPSLSFSCLSNSRMLAQCQECRVSGATGATAYTLTHLEWNKNSRSSYKKKGFSTRDSTTLRNGHAKNEILRARMNSSDLEWGNKVNMWILPVLLLGQ